MINKKGIIKRCIGCISLFIICTFFIGLILITTIYKIQLFGLIQKEKVSLFMSFSMIIAIIISVLIIIATKRDNRINDFFDNHIAECSIFIIFIMATILSINKEVQYKEKSLELIKISWTIFGICITIFTIWYSSIKNEYLKEDQTYIHDSFEKIEEKLFYDKLIATKKKTQNKQIRNIYEPIIFIPINIVFLVVTSGTIMLSIEYTIFTEMLLVSTFYLSTNTIIMVLFKIITKLYVERKELLKINSYSFEEVNKAEDNYGVYMLIKNLKSTKDMLFEKLVDDGSHDLEHIYQNLDSIVSKVSNDNPNYYEYKREVLEVVSQLLNYFDAKLTKSKKAQRKKIHRIRKGIVKLSNKID